MTQTIPNQKILSEVAEAHKTLYAAALAADFDFSLLREQKQVLLRVITEAERINDSTTAEGLTGILHLIDQIQDVVADEFGDTYVFEFEG